MSFPRDNKVDVSKTTQGYDETEDTTFQTTAAELDKELILRISQLHNAFKKAFADVKKDDNGNDKETGDHPSQLVYQTIYSEFQKIFSNIDGTESEESIKAKFENLQDLLVDHLRVYFLHHRDEIKNNPELMKKMGISDINQFDPKAFYENPAIISDRKKEIFASIIQVFQEFALERLYLKQGFKQDNALLKKIKEEYYLPSINQFVEKLNETEKKLANYIPAMRFAPPHTIDNLQADATNKEKLTAELKVKLNDKTTAIAKNYDQASAKLEERVYALVQSPTELQKKIAKYEAYYADVKKNIEQGVSDETIASMFPDLEKEYQLLQRDIAAYNQKNIPQLKKSLLADIEKEKNTNYSVEPLTDTDIASISAIQNIETHLAALSTIFSYTKEGSTIIPTGGLGREANELFEQALVNLTAVQKFIDIYNENIKASRVEAVKAYEKHVNQVKELSQKLQADCLNQTTLGTFEFLKSLTSGPWDEAKIVVENMLAVSASESALIDGGYDDLINNEITAAHADIQKILVDYDKARVKKWADFAQQVDTAKTLLEQYKKDSAALLRTLEAGIYKATQDSAKQKNAAQLEQMIETVNAIHVQKNTDTVEKPDVLVKLHQNKINERREAERVRQAEIERQEKIEKQAEEERIAAENKRLKEEAKANEEALRLAQEREKQLRKQNKQASRELPTLMANYQEAETKLENFFSSEENSRLYQDSRNLFRDLQVKDRQNWPAHGTEYEKSLHYKHYTAQYKNLELETKKPIQKNQEALTTNSPGGVPPNLTPNTPIAASLGNHPELLPLRPNPTAEKKPGFFKRHWKTITTTTSATMMVGAAVGAGIGVAIGVGAIPFTLGISLPATPILASITAAIGAGLGAVTGFISGVIGCAINDALDKKQTIALPVNPKEPEKSIKANKNELINSKDLEWHPEINNKPHLPMGQSSPTMYHQPANNNKALVDDFEHDFVKKLIETVYEGNAIQTRLKMERLAFLMRSRVGSIGFHVSLQAIPDAIIEQKGEQVQEDAKKIAKDLLENKYQALKLEDFKGSYLEQYVQHAYGDRTGDVPHIHQ